MLSTHKAISYSQTALQSYYTESTITVMTDRVPAVSYAVPLSARQSSLLSKKDKGITASLSSYSNPAKHLKH